MSCDSAVLPLEVVCCATDDLAGEAGNFFDEVFNSIDHRITAFNCAAASKGAETFVKIFGRGIMDTDMTHLDSERIGCKLRKSSFQALSDH